MKRVLAATLFVSTLAYPASRAVADDVPSSLSFNVSAGGFAFANRDHLKDNPVFDMRIGYDVIGNSILDSIGIEGGLSYISTQSRKDHSPVDAYLFRVDATYPFFPRSRVVPFATIGAGGMFMSRSTTMDKAPVLAYGLGMKYFVQEFIAVRADFRHNLLFDVHTRNDFQYMIGLSFLLDRDKKIRRLPLPPPPPKEKPAIAAPAVPVIEPEKPAPAPAAAPEKPVPVPIHLEPEQPKPQPEREEPAALPMLLPLVPAAPIGIAADGLSPAPVVETKPAPRELPAEPKPAEPKAEPQPQPEPVQAKPEPAAPVQSKPEPAPVQPAPVEPPTAPAVQPPPAPPVEPPPAPVVEPPTAPVVEPPPAPVIEPPPAPVVLPPPAPVVEPPPAPVVEPPPAPTVEPPPAPQVEPQTAPQVKLAPGVEPTSARQVEPTPVPRVEPSAVRVEPTQSSRVETVGASGAEPGSVSRVEPPAPRVQLETPPPPVTAPQVKLEQPYQLPDDTGAPQEQRTEEEVVASILCPDAPPVGSKPRQLAADSTTVLFDSGSAEVKPRFLPELKVIASYLKKHPQSSVYIEGHADSVGKPDYNMKLSKKRVASVKKSLTKTLGRAKAKIVTAAFGCRIPVDSNKKPDGRQKNRRATVEVKK